MTGKAGPSVPNRQAPDRPPRKRHWRRWILAGVALLAVLVVLAGVILVRHQPSVPPLALPSGRAAAPADPVSGAWHAAGSAAGFRVRESVLGMSGDITGRTDAVTGTLVIARSQVTQAVFRIDLARITVDGHTRAQFASSLDTKDHLGCSALSGLLN